MNIKDITSKAVEAEEIKMKIEELEKQVDQLNKQHHAIINDVLPAMMMEAEMHEFKLTSGTTVKLKTMIAGSIPSQGAINRAKGEAKEELAKRLKGCLDWLRSNEAGDLIKNEVSCKFASGNDKEAKRIFSIIKKEGAVPEQSSTVHPGKLNSFLKEMYAKGEAVPEDLFKIWSGQIATFELPKK